MSRRNSNAPLDGADIQRDFWLPAFEGMGKVQSAECSLQNGKVQKAPEKAESG